MDTVLIGGVGILLLIFVVWKAHGWLEHATVSPTLKRLVSYAMILAVIVAVGLVMKWHSSTWLAAQ